MVDYGNYDIAHKYTIYSLLYRYSTVYILWNNSETK